MSGNPLVLVGVYLSAATFLRLVKPNVLTALVLAVVLIVSGGVLLQSYGSEILTSFYAVCDKSLTAAGRPPAWPPEKHRSFPDLTLIDQDGRTTRLTDFRGRTLLIEPVGMSCGASVALAGGHTYGPCGGIAPQANLESLSVYAHRFGRFDWDDSRLVHIHLVLFNREMQAPTLAEIQEWARHFRLDRSRNHVVLAGTPDLAMAASRDLVPGCLLVDSRGVLRARSTGQSPQDSLYQKLLPMVTHLITQ